jgi:hypothetical protein
MNQKILTIFSIILLITIIYIPVVHSQEYQLSSADESYEVMCTLFGFQGIEVYTTSLCKDRIDELSEDINVWHKYFENINCEFEKSRFFSTFLSLLHKYNFFAIPTCDSISRPTEDCLVNVLSIPRVPQQKQTIFHTCCFISLNGTINKCSMKSVFSTLLSFSSILYVTSWFLRLQILEKFFLPGFLINVILFFPRLFLQPFVKRCIYPNTLIKKPVIPLAYLQSRSSDIELTVIQRQHRYHYEHLDAVSLCSFLGFWFSIPIKKQNQLVGFTAATWFNEDNFS